MRITGNVRHGVNLIPVHGFLQPTIKKLHRAATLRIYSPPSHPTERKDGLLACHVILEANIQTIRLWRHGTGTLAVGGCGGVGSVA